MRGECVQGSYDHLRKVAKHYAHDTAVRNQYPPGGPFAMIEEVSA